MLRKVVLGLKMRGRKSSGWAESKDGRQGMKVVGVAVDPKGWRATPKVTRQNDAKDQRLNPGEEALKIELELWPNLSADGAVVDWEEMPPDLVQWLQTAEGDLALQQLRQRDQRIRARLEEVEVPSEGMQRLVAKFAELADESVCGHHSEIGQPVIGTAADRLELETIEASAVANEPVSLVARPERERSSRPLPRRSWLTYASAAALLLAITGTLVAWVIWYEPRPLGRTELAQSSLNWAGRLDSRLWHDLESQVLLNAPVPEELGVRPVRWALIETDWDDETVVYDLVGPEDRTVWLYVIDVHRSFAVPDRFSLVPDYTTGQFAVGSMQRDGKLYVLMVEGDLRRYRRQIRSVGPLG